MLMISSLFFSQFAEGIGAHGFKGRDTLFTPVIGCVPYFAQNVRAEEGEKSSSWPTDNRRKHDCCERVATAPTAKNHDIFI